MWAERKSALQGSGLVRTVGRGAQRSGPNASGHTAWYRRVRIVERAVQSAAHFERPAEQVLATEP